MKADSDVQNPSNGMCEHQLDLQRKSPNFTKNAKKLLVGYLLQNNLNFL
jgi:hypothetical protein